MEIRQQKMKMSYWKCDESEDEAEDYDVKIADMIR